MPNDDYILRKDAIEALVFYVRRYYKDIVLAGILQSILERVPVADVKPVVRCRDCRYKAHVKPEYLLWKPLYPFITPGGYEIEFPDEENNPCPFLDGDPYGSIMPPDDFFCAYGAKMDKDKEK